MIKDRPLVLYYLLTLMAVLMGAHMSLLILRDVQCRAYEQTLLNRLEKVPPGGKRAINIRNEIQNFFSGRYNDCSQTADDYSVVSDKYLAVILSLLTGAGVAGGVVMADRMNRKQPEQLPPPPDEEIK